MIKKITIQNKKEYQLKIKRKWKKCNIKISKNLRDIIHGYIMSDGYVSPTGWLQVEQSKKQQKFVEWLFHQLQPLTKDANIYEKTRIDKRNGTKTYSKRFFTKSLLNGFRNMWYTAYTGNEGKLQYRKSLPKSIHCFFNPIFITLWFAGDGTKMRNQRGAKLEVTDFTAQERNQLKQLFKTKFNISVTINRAGISKKGTEQWTLSINSIEYDKFRDLITKIDLIPTLFPYKLHSVRNP